MKNAFDPAVCDAEAAYCFESSTAGGEGRLVLYDRGMCAIFQSEIVPFPFAEISSVQYTYATRTLSFYHAKSFHAFSFAEGFVPAQLLQQLKRLVKRAHRSSTKYDFSPLKPIIDDGYLLGVPAQINGRVEAAASCFADQLNQILKNPGFSVASGVRARLLQSIRKELRLRIEILDVLADAASRLALAVQPMQEAIYRLTQVPAGSRNGSDEPDLEDRELVKD